MERLSEYAVELRSANQQLRQRIHDAQPFLTRRQEDEVVCLICEVLWRLPASRWGTVTTSESVISLATLRQPVFEFRN